MRCFALLHYLVTTHARLGAKRIGNLLSTKAEKRQEKALMDVLDELRQEGREEGERIGERRGERKGRARTLLELLAARFGPVPAEAKCADPGRERADAGTVVPARADGAVAPG